MTDGSSLNAIPKPPVDVTAGMIAEYTALAHDYIGRYTPSKSGTLAALLNELGRISHQAYQTAQKKFSPEDERVALGEIGVSEGQAQVHNSLAMALGAVNAIAKYDTSLQSQVAEPQGESPNESLVKGGALTQEHFASIASGLYACSRHLGECMGAAIEGRTRYPVAQGDKKLAGPLSFDRGNAKGRHDDHLCFQMARVVGAVLVSHGIENPSLPGKDHGPDALVTGQILGMHKSFAEAVEKGRAAKRSGVQVL